MGPGSVVSNKYRLLRSLGEGGMGAVWEALNLRTQRRFALKLVRGDAQTAPELYERMLREASVAGRLEHPNVIEVYDVGETEAGEPYLVMELLRGESLAELLDRAGTLDSVRAAAVGAEIAAALEAAHAAEIVHRDLKPANVFLHEDAGHGRVVKVLDFGVSKLMTPGSPSATATGAPIGTPAYMSPEQAEGRRDVDQRTDLWAVGVMLFEMASGRLPFGGATAFAVVGEVLHAPVPRLDAVVPGADPRLVEIVARCLTRDPTQRFASARELRVALESLLPKRASAVVADFDEDATLSRKVPRAPAPPPEISDTATTAVVPPRAAVPALTPPAPPARTRMLVVGIAGVALLFVVGLGLGSWVWPGAAEAPDVQSSLTPAPVPSAAAALAPEPSASSEPARTVPDAGASKKSVVRSLPCPKDKLLIDPATGKLTCVRK
ncbi:MAG: serine/threonine protein kinase [Polyangiaceae bacterium]|nr:serine/threonine protein kinase [Polyangiaceae bacterium]